MSRNIACYLLGALSLGCAVVAQAQQATGATEKAVAALEEKWVQAERANNAELITPLLGDKFVMVDQDGKIFNRTEAIADAKATKFSSVEIEDLKVTVFGDTAIARGTYKSKGAGADGKAFDSHSRWTDTWVKMPNGKWQCVASHGSRVTM